MGTNEYLVDKMEKMAFSTYKSVSYRQKTQIITV